MRISDWSSDVCSSDLDPGGRLAGNGVDQDGGARVAVGGRGADADHRLGLSARRPEAYGLMMLEIAYFAWVRERMGVAGETIELPTDEIGRASCRERVCQYV